MTLPRLNALPAALLALTVLGTGCVSQDSHDDLLTINRQLEERRTTLEQEVANLRLANKQANSAIAALEARIARLAALEARYTEDQATIAEKNKTIAQLRAEIAKLGSGQDKIVVVEGLPPEVSDALRDLAAANPDLMVYDADRGMIRLRSDLTFGLGSDVVSDSAKTALSRLANVLTGGAAAQFDIQVVGHTDAVPVKSARGKQLYGDNRGLSSNRGDSVARVLIANGVSAGRVVSGGRGATQPIEANNAKGQSKANRRVEIFLVKASDAPAPAPAPAGGAPTGGSGGGVGEGAAEPADPAIFK
ncbi:MAG: OmpA family protein [Phycisphaeraceae bacterium]|nr:OmpA family protein [Phycisphaeraceae bacterium]